MEPFDASRPSPSSLVDLITSRYPGTIVAEAMHAWFFSLNDQAWPNFATIVTTDEHDDASDLFRPGTFRLNIGVSGATFDRLVGDASDAADAAAPDHTAADVLLPHPVYAAQHWVSIVNPSAERLERDLLPLLDEAHARLAAQEARRGRPTPTSQA